MWRKSWLECRFRVVLNLVVGIPLLCAAFTILHDPDAGGKHPELTYDLLMQMMSGMVIPVTTLLLAGSGVNSQTSWGMLHGFHASMYFLLSMPVSRRRALLIRAAVGGAFVFLFTAGMTYSLWQLGIWRGVPLTASYLLSGILFLTITGFAWFGFATFLTTMFDEFWGGIIGLTLAGFVFGLGLALQGKNRGSLLSYAAGLHFARTGDVVWPATLAFLAVGFIFMAISIYIVERKEY